MNPADRPRPGTVVPVLAFHALGRGHGPIWTEPDDFARLIDAVLEAGYEPVHAREIAAMTRGTPPAALKPIAITFDDGYESVHREALPILARRHLSATVFWVTGSPGRNNWDAPGSFGGGLTLLGESSIMALVEAGWEIGSHTHTHKRLRGVSPTVVADELSRSQDALGRMGLEVSTMAYPYGDYDNVSAAIVRARLVGGFAVGARFAHPADDPAAIERIDAWYLQRRLVQRHLGDIVGRSYLAVRQGLRSVGSRTRRNDGA